MHSCFSQHVASFPSILTPLPPFSLSLPLQVIPFPLTPEGDALYGGKWLAQERSEALQQLFKLHKNYYGEGER